jgi:putative ABC transport system ATP-binding protein
VPAQRRRAEEQLAAVGLADRAGSYPDRLSGGEQQRIAIARAIVHRPQLLLADEPTGNLDAESGQMVLGLLQQLVQAGGLTLLLVTHSVEVAAIASRVLTLREGRLLEEGR